MSPTVNILDRMSISMDRDVISGPYSGPTKDHVQDPCPPGLPEKLTQ